VLHLAAGLAQDLHTTSQPVIRPNHTALTDATDTSSGFGWCLLLLIEHI